MLARPLPSGAPSPALPLQVLKAADLGLTRVQLGSVLSAADKFTEPGTPRPHG